MYHEVVLSFFVAIEKDKERRRKGRQRERESGDDPTCVTKMRSRIK